MLERKPATDAVFTMTPPPRLAMWRTATLVHLTTPVMFTLGKFTSTSSIGSQIAFVNMHYYMSMYSSNQPSKGKNTLSAPLMMPAFKKAIFWEILLSHDSSTCVCIHHRL